MASPAGDRPIGLVLAGGRARRMGGGDKPLLQIGGRTILARILARLSGQCAQVAISANDDPSRFVSFGCPVVADTVPDHAGPLAGVLAGMAFAANHGAQSLLTVSGDCPFLPADLAARLACARQAEGKAIARAASGGRVHPAVALWPITLRADLQRALADGRNKVGDFQETHGCAIAEWSSTPYDPFFNVNTPADAEAAEGIALEWPWA